MVLEAKHFALTPSVKNTGSYNFLKMYLQSKNTQFNITEINISDYISGNYMYFDQ